MRPSRNGPGTDKVYEISTPIEAEEDRPATNHTERQDQRQLEEYFERYRELFRDEVILVQELVEEKTEYSAVMLSGVTPYYIKRIEGPAKPCPCCSEMSRSCGSMCS